MGYVIAAVSEPARRISLAHGIERLGGRWRSGIPILSHKPEDFGPDGRIVFDSSGIHRKFIASCYLTLSSHGAEGSFIVGLVPDYCRGRVEPTSEKGVRRTIAWEEEPMSIEHMRYSDAGRH